MEDEELIREEMEQTRESLTDKLDTLEKKLSASVEEVAGVVNTAKETVHESVESVKHFADIKAHVEEHPWLMVGGAAACGYVLGTLLMREKPAPSGKADALPPPSPPLKALPTHGNGHHKRDKQAAPAVTPPPEPKQDMFGAFKPELDMLKSMALGAALSALRDVIAAEVSPPLAEQVRTIIDNVTRKMGGEPLPPSEPATTQPAPAQTAAEGALDLEKPRW